jgi:hypothetical protein
MLDAVETELPRAEGGRRSDLGLTIQKHDVSGVAQGHADSGRRGDDPGRSCRLTQREDKIPVVPHERQWH